MHKPFDIPLIALTLLSIFSCHPASNRQIKIDSVSVPSTMLGDTTLLDSMNDSNQMENITKRCHQTKDQLTGLIFYENPEKSAENTGGIDALRRTFEKQLTVDLTAEDVPANPSGIAFIIDTNGIILGERISATTDSSIGKQMIKVVKSFSWKPAECNGKRVTSMVKQTLILEFQ